MLTAEHIAGVITIAKHAGAASSECLASRLLEQQVATLLEIFTHLTEIPEDNDEKRIPELFLSISSLMEEIQAWGSQSHQSYDDVDLQLPTDEMISQLSFFNKRVVLLVNQYHEILESKQNNNNNQNEELSIINQTASDDSNIIFNKAYLIDFTCNDCFLPFRSGMQLTQCINCHCDLCSSCRHMDVSNVAKQKLSFLCYTCQSSSSPIPQVEPNSQVNEESNEMEMDFPPLSSQLPPKPFKELITSEKKFNNNIQIPDFVPPIQMPSNKDTEKEDTYDEDVVISRQEKEEEENKEET
mmetsp:Transcript_16002/g.20733  ORF Transcript_16002/g.20733 Transcript_16002/m.20733 type:complete len:298 (-) Transcript_16002:203-1096(-)